jgi:hypothetical protein
MEPADIFTVVILVVMLGEAYSRRELTHRSGLVIELAIASGGTPQPPTNIETELLGMPRPPDRWSPGLGSYLNARPMLVFMLIVLVLTAFLGSVGLVATVPKAILLALAFVLAIAFHSGPDRYTLFEYYLHLKSGIDGAGLDNRDLGIITHVKSQFEFWVLLQAIFAIGLYVGVILPLQIAAAYVILFVLIVFVVLGCAYEVEKGIFAGPA